MQDNQLTEEEKDYLLILLTNLNNSQNIQNIETLNNYLQMNVNPIYHDYINQISVILKGLSLTKIRNKELSLQEYKSLFIHMKNIVIMNQKRINLNNINEILIKLILILLKPDVEFIQYNNVVLMILQLIKIICDKNDELIKDYKKIENLFKIILDNTSQNNLNKDEFLIKARNSLMIYMCLFEANLINGNNFLNLIQKYIISICDIVFAKTKIYIIPFVVYDIQFITILKCLYELLVVCFKKMKRFFPSLKKKEISDNFLIKYGYYSLDLIKLIPIFEKDEKNMNNILVFKSDYKELNAMKSNIFLFLCLILENWKYSQNNIINSDFTKLIYQFILLIEESFKQILKNESTFLNLREIDEEEKIEEEEYYNTLLYNMIYFLCNSIIIEPIKSEFNKNIQIFLLNYIFPLLVTVKSEDNYMKKEPEQYCIYLNDLLYKLSLKNFRVAGLILIKKICDNFEDAPNFIFSYLIGMLDDLINSKENKNNEINNKNIDFKYNIYLNYKTQNIIFNKYNDETKLDFCLLILILLQDNLLKYNILKNRLRETLIKAGNNFLSIKNALIKIKLSHFFKFAIPNLFNIENEQVGDNNIDNNEINKQNISFVEMALTYLFNNLKSINDGDLFSDSLKNEVSEIIIYLCKFTEDENDILGNGINFLLQKEFHSLLNLIDNIKLYSFFSVIEQIIKSVKIKNRNDIFICLEKLTKRFIDENETGDVNSQLYCPLYFSIISNFFKGINQINRDDINFAEEINRFNDIFKPILNQLEDINSFIYYENLIKSMTDYLKCFQGVNDQSVSLIKIMLKIVERDRQFSEDNFHFLSTFLTYFQLNPLINNNILENIFDLIIKILEQSFSYEFGSFDSSKLYALLTTLQIYNKNMNISNDVNKILISNTVKCFNYIFAEDENYGNFKMKQDKNNIIFGILALGFIFKPKETYNLLIEAEIMVNKPKNFYGEFEYEKFNFEKYIEILNYINIYQIENELLRKCLLLGFCSIIKNDNLRIFLDNNKDLKKKFIIIFANFILEHKKAEIEKRNRIMKDELNYSEVKVNEDGKIKFKDISDSDNEEEEEENEEEDEDKEKTFNKINTDISYILEQNINIKNSDEFQFFKESLDFLKLTDIECINYLNKELSNDKLKQLEDIYHVKKVKVNYQGKEFEIPRKILNIKKNL